ncbi:MAG: HAD family hydrolase [Methylococcales bacterium]|nr:HAD family hydrolase [Methylococcales bacterium]
MKQSIIYALDFDGVICDSAIETGMAGWKAAIQIWDEIDTPLPSQEILDQFRKARPIIETGYESILMMKMLHSGEHAETILNDFYDKKDELIRRSGLDIEMLKQLFGETRDNWIKDNLNEWVEMNPLFSGIAEKLKRFSSQELWYIITTKQERFVKHILNANQINLSDDRIFGLDKKKSKEAVLLDLVDKHSQETIYFVEDRLPALVKVIKNEKLASVQLFFAVWGYNTEKDKLDAQQKPIKLIGLDEFLG